ncbi:MAG: hypothetical protein KJ558_04220 [Gammaproteobacteria bacterium]|nr:hypothetical protein [Gammaproteobacteria bacterium]MBU1654028.1 hypothetical protein [Gammaproteobacteria bacterium]MBU1959697.1 hypothetical protein [Gammaproteobacteria bacterium]
MFLDPAWSLWTSKPQSRQQVHNRRLFKELDKWIRVRLRSMKFKRKWKTDNRRLRLKHFRHMGLLSLHEFYAQPV